MSSTQFGSVQLPIIDDQPADEADLKDDMVPSQTPGPAQSRSSGVVWRTIGRAPRFLSAMVAHRCRRDVGPHSLTHTTTFKCNYHCKEICDSPLVHQVMQRQTNGHDLTTAEIDSIYNQLPAMDYVRFTGGEPTLRQDFIELSHLAEKHLRPIVLHLTTNGSQPERVVRFALERPRHVPLDLMISIDGVGDKHAWSRHNAKAYDRCMEVLDALAPRQKELRMNIRINQTIADLEGIAHYRQLHAILKPYGVRHQIVMAYDASATYAVERNRSYAPTAEELFTPVGQFSNEELQDFFGEVHRDIQNELNGSERWIQQYYLDGIRERMVNNSATPNPKCVALSSHLRIFPNGDVPTCQFNSHIVGNLRLQSFQELWSGAERLTQREWVKNCAGCWAGCEVQPSGAYTGDVLRHAMFGTPHAQQHRR